METIVETTKEGCQTKAKKNIKSRIIADRERARVKLQGWQDEVNDLLNQYDNEWITPPTITDEEMN